MTAGCRPNTSAPFGLTKRVSDSIDQVGRKMIQGTPLAFKASSAWYLASTMGKNRRFSATLVPETSPIISSPSLGASSTTARVTLRSR